MPQGSLALVGAKLAYVKELVTADKSMSMFAVAKKVEEKFSEALAPDKLRAAFLEHGGTISPRRAKNKAGTQSPADTQLEASPKVAKRTSGRRKADKLAAKAERALAELGKHIVVVRTTDGSEVHEFASRETARQFLSDQLSAGVPASSFGFYERESLALTIGI